jgi:Anti-sigma factor NepR
MTDKKDKDSSGFGALPPPYAKLKSRPSARRPNGIDPAIGKTMRAMYEDLVNQPIPERFVELLEQLDRARENNSQ